MTDQCPVHPKPAKTRRYARKTLGIAFRAARNALALGMLGVLALVFTPATDAIYRWLSVSTPRPGTADYIVCLGGGTGRETKAAQLWHRKAAPLVIVSNAPGAAQWMQSFIAHSGVPRASILVDQTSLKTRDHPAGVARLPGVDPQRQRFILVTDHAHSRRARDVFRNAGYRNFTVFGGFPTPAPARSYWGDCEWRILMLPSVVYECAAFAKYWWLGLV